MADAKIRSERPISPHLTIYRLTLTMAMSIAHRLTGMALYFGTLLLVWWLVAAATSARQYDLVNAVFSSWIGRIVLFGYTWALMHHMLGGMRHLIWDTGRGFEPAEREFLARATIIGSIALTFAVWILAYVLKG
jgi:succinate dehydrogenase / fumarate reductase cytochrome b subunit